MKKGLLIALEGIDGSGHSTQANYLREELEKDYTLSDEDEPIAVLSKEPTDGPIGGEIREFLSERLEVDSETLALMFAADRRDHVENELEPLVNDGKIVILDRYILSSLAYQGVNIADTEWLEQINSKAMEPDLTILLDVSPKVAKRRMEQDRLRTDIFEDQDMLEQVRQKYLELANSLSEDGQDIRIVDGENSENYVRGEIKSIVYEKIRNRGELLPGNKVNEDIFEYIIRDSSNH